MQPGSSLRIILTIALLLGAHVVWGADTWIEDYVGSALSQPPGWLDETEDSSRDAEIFYSYTPSYAAITRTATGTQGSVLSPTITCNVNSYGNIKISIISISPSAAWKISIVKGDFSQTWVLNDFTIDTGVLVYNYAEITGMNGTNTFYIQLTLQGSAGENMEVDYISINNEEVPTPTF
ncbi:hypothetical protein KAR34_14125, partial [bacterium]|nr:hypothetical protein [bacterium]